LKLYALAGDQTGLEAAIQRAIPNSSKVDGLLAQRADFEKELAEVETGKQNLIRVIAKGIVSDEEAARNMAALKDRESAILKAIDGINRQTVGLPTRSQISAQAALAKRTLESIFSRPGHVAKMSFEDKRKLVQAFFGGHDPEGKRLGVYVRKSEDGVQYTITGILGNFEGILKPDGIDPVELAEMGLPLEFSQDLVQAQSGGKREVCKSVSECHAHHCVRLY